MSSVVTVILRCDYIHSLIHRGSERLSGLTILGSENQQLETPVSSRRPTHFSLGQEQIEHQDTFLKITASDTSHIIAITVTCNNYKI